MTAEFLGVPFSEDVGYFLEGTDSVHQLFDFLERGEHALVNFNPRFAQMLIYMRVMPQFVHAVYGGNDLYAQTLLPYKSICRAQTEKLVVSPSPAPTSSARKASPATRMTTRAATATGFLRTCLINLERPPVHI